MSARARTRRRTLVAGLALALLPAARAVQAADLAQAKRDGLLGERIDGFVGVVQADAPAEIRALAEEINAKRRQEYARIAEREGVSVQAVAQLAGEKLIARAGPGEWVVGADGRWRQK